MALTPGKDVLIEGGARGADLISAQYGALLQGLRVEEYPAKWHKHGKAAGPIRNQQMLDEGRPDEVWAFHDDIQSSKGTRDMCERAKRAGIPVYVVSHYQSGADQVREAVRQARGGDAPVAAQGYA